MSSQEILWTAIAAPTALVSVIVTLWYMLAYKPTPKRPLLYGFCTTVIALALIIGIAFANVLVAIVLIALFLPGEGVWLWFMMRPSIKSINSRAENYKKNLDDYRNEKKDYQNKRGGK